MSPCARSSATHTWICSSLPNDPHVPRLPRLLTLLTSVDALRGPEREEALQSALGVHSRLLTNHDAGTRTAVPLGEDMQAFRALAEAVEEGVRGAREDVLGLDWDGV